MHKRTYTLFPILLPILTKHAEHHQGSPEPEQVDAGKLDSLQHDIIGRSELVASSMGILVLFWRGDLQLHSFQRWGQYR